MLQFFGGRRRSGSSVRDRTDIAQERDHDLGIDDRPHTTQLLLQVRQLPRRLPECDSGPVSPARSIPARPASPTLPPRISLPPPSPPPSPPTDSLRPRLFPGKGAPSSLSRTASPQGASRKGHSRNAVSAVTAETANKARIVLVRKLLEVQRDLKIKDTIIESQKQKIAGLEQEIEQLSSNRKVDMDLIQNLRRQVEVMKLHNQNLTDQMMRQDSLNWPMEGAEEPTTVSDLTSWGDYPNDFDAAPPSEINRDKPECSPLISYTMAGGEKPNPAGKQVRYTVTGSTILSSESDEEEKIEVHYDR